MQASKRQSSPRGSTLIKDGSGIAIPSALKPRKSVFFPSAESLGDKSLEPENRGNNGPSSPGVTTINSVGILWGHFEKLIKSMKLEIENINQHFDIEQLEVDAVKALESNCIKAKNIGEVETKNVKIDFLDTVLKVHAGMEAKGFTLPDNILHLLKAAALICSIRKSVLAGDWDSLPTLLEDTVLGTTKSGGKSSTGSNKSNWLPESCRQELQTIRAEVENRWIIQNITTALQQGKLEGSPGNVKLNSVTIVPLSTCLDACKALQPRTPNSLMLVYTGEVVLPLRKLLCDHPVNWVLVQEC
jgi:hypothetical protein